MHRTLIQAAVVLLGVWPATLTCRARAIDVGSVRLRLVEQVEVPARVAGVLRSLVVREGDRIRKGVRTL